MSDALFRCVVSQDCLKVYASKNSGVFKIWVHVVGSFWHALVVVWIRFGLLVCNEWFMSLTFCVDLASLLLRSSVFFLKKN